MTGSEPPRPPWLVQRVALGSCEKVSGPLVRSSYHAAAFVNGPKNCNP